MLRSHGTERTVRLLSPILSQASNRLCFYPSLLAFLLEGGGPEESSRHDDHIISCRATQITQTDRLQKFPSSILDQGNILE